MTKVIGNNDGPGGRNESYKIGSRSNVPRAQAVKEVEAVSIPGLTWSGSRTGNTFGTIQMGRHATT